MKFIAKNLNLIGLFLLASFGAAAAGLYFDVPQMLRSKPVKAAAVAVESPLKSDGCCADKAKPEPAPAPASCPHLAAQADPGCGSGCSHH
ncbi:MAG TPA: hypothetical protein VFZ59_25545 [Verrucomicrobiae bacterium]|nr:hypothetical protein [Verrucomicrobiae bacterium]